MADSNPRRLRWWPLLLILAAVVVAVVYRQWNGARDRQMANMDSAAYLVGALLLVMVWWLLFSRIRFWRRLQGAAAFLAVMCGLGVAFEFRGVDGNLLPVFDWRYHDLVTAEALPAPVRSLPGLADSGQFFGPARDGRVADPGLATDWSTTPPVVLWRRGIGAGWSGFAVVGDAAITQDQRGEQEAVVCLDLATGVERWVHLDPAHYDNPVAGEGPRATPTVHNGLVYTMGSTGVLNCLDLATGERRWTRQVIEENGAVQPEWGAVSSPLIVDELVVVSAGGPSGRSLVSYHCRTGAPGFAAGSVPSHWSSPVLLRLAGRRQILIFNATELTSHDAEQGAVLWRYPWPATHPHVCMPMAVAEDLVLVSSGYGTGSKLLRISAGADGAQQAEEVWHSRAMKAKFANLVVDRGHAFGFDDGIFACIELTTGKRRWKRGRYGHGQLLLVGKLLLVMGEQGELVLLAADPERHHEYARLSVFTDKTWNPPALAGRYLLLRNDREAVCLRLPLR